MRQPYFIGAALAALMLAGAGCAANERPAVPEPPQTAAPSGTAPAVVVPNIAPARIMTFVVVGARFKFSVTEMKVRVGDRVKVVFQNVDGIHDWKIDEFHAATKRLQAGQSETIEFVAAKAGTFEYYCSVANHRQLGMKGNLIVE